MTATSATHLPPPTSTTLRRAAVASTVGSAVEFYEFTVYGMLAVIFAPLFFPSDNATASTLSALAVYGAGYVARPVGGALFGAIGDRIGRRTTLMATIFLMGAASSLISVLPTYSSIGLAAPAILMVLRLVQGVSAGGEFTGAQTYIVEMAPPRRRGVLGSLPAMGIAFGFSFAALLVSGLLTTLSREDMSNWGWRLPFLICVPMTLGCLVLRLRLEDSPEFRAVVDNADISRSPLVRTLREHPVDVLRVALMTIGVLGPGFLIKLYLGIHLVQRLGYAPSHVYGMLGLLLLLTAALFPLMGRVSDRVGRRPVARIGFVAFVVLSLPLFLVVNASPSLWVMFPAVLLFAAIEPFMSAAVYTSFAELFPTAVRYTATSIGFNLGAIVGAGFGAYICGRLVEDTGWNSVPGVWGIFCALLGLVALMTTRETSRNELYGATSVPDSPATANEERE